jgi:hypothetical protein
MNKSICSFMIIVSCCIFFSGCDSTAKVIRDNYPKISNLSGESNLDKFTGSSFRNYFLYKTSLKSDFNQLYFLSYSYHHHSEYSSVDIDVYSTLLSYGNTLVALGNIFDSAYVKKNSNVSLTSYLIMDESVISKNITFELGFAAKDIGPGRLRGTSSNRSATLAIKDKHGNVLFDISDEKSYVAVEIVSVENNVVYGKFNAQLVGRKHEVYLNIQEGEFWVRI